MDRLGLGYETLKDLNAGLVYCAITGYGQHGPRAQVAAHDLNYLAESGLLSLGQPAVPPALIADIAGGAYPAVMNILLALRRRERDGKGCKLDVSMSDNLFTFMYWALGDGQAAGRWPGSAESLVTGGSPRYNVYRTRDGRFVAAAPLEDRFWQNFCAVLSIPMESSIEGVQKRIAEKTSEEWRAAFAGKDVCCAIVATVREAFDDPHFRGRGLFAHKVKTDAGELIATPVPVAGAFRDPAPAGYPRLGEANDLLKR
jgi:crotonobetainyl-CoA:carnitine CoA-transferase CaiB-like acyl-CoA transferase